jgi:phosphoglycerate dehydrogenase-like enzyme
MVKAMHILIIESHYQIYHDALKELLPDAVIISTSSIEHALTEAGQCSFWIGQPDLIVGLLSSGMKPEFVQSSWAGFEALLAPDLPKDYVFCRAVDVFGQSMAEYVLSYILAHERQHQLRYQSQNAGIWDDTQPGTLSGKTLLIAGAGNIGASVAGFFRPFGVRLLGVARTIRDYDSFDYVGCLNEMSDLVGKSDYVVNLLPDTPETRNLFNESLFQCFRRTAVFVNAGRGSAVVEPDLIKAINNGWLAKAVLDVFCQEPLQPNSTLWSTPGILLTAHVAAPSAPLAVAQLFVDNVNRLKGRIPLRGQVELGKYQAQSESAT